MFTHHTCTFTHTSTHPHLQWPSPPETDPIPTRESIVRTHEQRYHRGSNTPNGIQDTPPGGNTPHVRSSRRPVNPYPVDTTGDMWREDNSDEDCFPPSKCQQCKVCVVCV